MNELSGGQKALVALCLIFAIQRCDPAPFYLFDEIDQALDDKNRMAVANLIKSQNEFMDNKNASKKRKRKKKLRDKDGISDESDADLEEKDQESSEEEVSEEDEASQGTQFITTTFRPELVSVANQVLAASYENKISEVQPLPKEQAMNFIKSLAEEEGEEIERQTRQTRASLEKDKP